MVELKEWKIDSLFESSSKKTVVQLSTFVENIDRHGIELAWQINIRFIACGIEPRHRIHDANEQKRDRHKDTEKNEKWNCLLAAAFFFIRICSDLQIICHVLFVCFSLSTQQPIWCYANYTCTNRYSMPLRVIKQMKKKRMKERNKLK